MHAWTFARFFFQTFVPDFKGKRLPVYFENDVTSSRDAGRSTLLRSRPQDVAASVPPADPERPMEYCNFMEAVHGVEGLMFVKCITAAKVDFAAALCNQ